MEDETLLVKIEKFAFTSNSISYGLGVLFSGAMMTSYRSVEDIWKEYMYGVGEKMSIKEMDSKYRKHWRFNNTLRLRYCRRMKVVHKIKTILVEHQLVLVLLEV